VAEQLIKLKYYRRHIEDRDKVDKLVNKKALIFGATGGIGSEIVKMFQKMGVKMLAPSSKQLDLEIVSVKDVLNYCKDFKPDIIINAAAYSATDDDGLVNMFDKVFKINLKSNLILIEFAKLLNKRVNLVLFSSSSSTKGRENLTLYSAAKVGVNSIVESLAEKMSKHGVYINAIVPEKINTPMIQKLHKGKVIYKELLSVEDILDAVIYYSSADTFGELAHIRRGL
jgi:2-C-methyl-D-erythritol 4-phosphate cytidylyltransferase